MALTEGMSGRGTLAAATEEIAYDPSKSERSEVKAMRVHCTHATVGCFVRIPSIMGDVAVGAGVYLPPVDELVGGGFHIFRANSRIGPVYVSGDALPTTVAWGPVE